MKGNVQIFPGIAQRISMATRWKREEKDTFIQDDIDHRGASQNYRFAKEILPLWGSAENQGYS